jgi:hypothetical protein
MNCMVAWHAVFILNKPIPRQTPTPHMVVRPIAQRGGFVRCKGDGAPSGARTLRQGMREVAVHIEGSSYARRLVTA